MATDEENSAPAASGSFASTELPIRTNGMPSSSAAPAKEEPPAFEIVATYHRLLADDPDLTMAVAAIEAMIELLGHTTSSTVMETLDIIRTQADRLKASVPNPIPLAAGTDLFQQYLIRSLKQPPPPLLQASPSGTDSASAAGGGGVGSFEDTRQHLLQNTRLFAARAKAARDVIADLGSRYIRDGSVVLAAGGSRTVKRLLLCAADRHIASSGCPRFRVIYVMDGSPDSEPAVRELRARGVLVATVKEGSVAHVLPRAHMVFVGTEAVVQNGGLLSRVGTYQLAQLAAAQNKPFYVAAETHKIVRIFPLDQTDLQRCGVKQEALDFKNTDDAPTESSLVDDHLVDYTPPELITHLITDQGMKLPSSIYEYILDIYT